jgi:hypothetical protein
MQPDVILIQQPSVDYARFLDAACKVLGYSPAAAADASRRALSEAARFLSCLAAMRDPQAPVAVSPHLMAHVSFSLLILADERDMVDILQCAAGLPFVIAETVARGVYVAAVTGTLAQWRDAVVSGARPDVKTGVRACFNKILIIFEGMGINVWGDYRRRQANDHTLLLEDKRGR